MAKKLDWDAAKEHLCFYKEAYQDIGPAGIFGLMRITELEQRLENGERTKWLYDDIMSVE